MDEIEDSDTISPTNDSMMANKFVVSLNTICLDVSKPVQLIIKYDYSIFSTKPCTTGYPFQISPSKSEDFKIPTGGYKEYEFIMKKSEMKIALDLTPLALNIFDKKEQLISVLNGRSFYGFLMNCGSMFLQVLFHKNIYILLRK